MSFFSLSSSLADGALFRSAGPRAGSRSRLNALRWCELVTGQMANQRFFNIIIPSTLAGIVGCYLGSSVERYRSNLYLAKAASPTHFPGDRSGPSLPSDGGDASFNFPDLGKKLPETSSRHLDIMKHGYPSFETIRTYGNFVLSYDRRNRTPNWVMEHLTPERVHKVKDGSVDRSKCEFFEDHSIHPYFRSSNIDYKGSGYDRGHLAAARNHAISQDFVNQTFILSNIAPQVGKGFNRDVWNTLEQYVRYRTHASRNLWVCSGPLYLPKKSPDGQKYVTYKVIGPNNVSVPTHFFKVLLIENIDGKLELESYVVENIAHDPYTPILAFQVPLDAIERAAGFLIFDQVPKTSLKQINGKNEQMEKFMNKWITLKQKELHERAKG